MNESVNDQLVRLKASKDKSIYNQLLRLKAPKDVYVCLNARGNVIYRSVLFSVDIKSMGFPGDFPVEGNAISVRKRQSLVFSTTAASAGNIRLLTPMSTRSPPKCIYQVIYGK